MCISLMTHAALRVLFGIKAVVMNYVVTKSMISFFSGLEKIYGRFLTRNCKVSDNCRGPTNSENIKLQLLRTLYKNCSAQDDLK